jgi:hypothetical protein
MLHDSEKSTFHLSNALRINFKKRTILRDLFPVVWEMKKLQDLIEKYKG